MEEYLENAYEIDMIANVDLIFLAY